MKNQQALTYSQLIGPKDAATAAVTANLDCQEANYATVLVSLGAELNTNATNVAIQLSESDDTVVTNFATFDSDFQRTVDNTGNAVAVNHVHMEGRKRYLRVTVTPDTTTNGPVEISVVGILCKDLKSGTASDYGDDVVIG